MAHIPVQAAKRGVPGWLWLVLALVVAALVAFFLLANDDDDLEETGSDSTRVVRPAPATTTAVTSLDDMPADSDPADPADRRVDVTATEVIRVLSDQAFVLRSDGGREVVVIHQERDGVSTAGSAGRFEVAVGDRVDVRGRLRRATASMDVVPEAARAFLREGALYVAAPTSGVRALVDPSGGGAMVEPAPTFPEETTAPPIEAPAPPPPPPADSMDSGMTQDSTTP